MPESVERIIRELLQKRFLTRQKRSLSAFHREVARACKLQKLRLHARNTVASRIAGLDPLKTTRLREGQDASRTLQGVGAEPPAVTAPLEQVQIDHTVIDLIVVDELDRQPIGRPYLTLAIDVFTRCVPGMVVTQETPSAVLVGLCLAHIACDKRPWLEGLNVEMDWPMSGKPMLLYLDNAAEFKSEALRRGCEQHGIRLDYRPQGQPHYGGIVERIIGTAMQMIHDELPGTTFSNPDQRGDYDSESKATLTLRELERWLTLAVGTYHSSVHNGLLQPPEARWAGAVARAGMPAVVTRAGLASARSRGLKGGRPFKMTTAKLRLAMAAMGNPRPRLVIYAKSWASRGRHYTAIFHQQENCELTERNCSVSPELSSWIACALHF